jgi:hypothetical protein
MVSVADQKREAHRSEVDGQVRLVVVEHHVVVVGPVVDLAADGVDLGHLVGGQASLGPGELAHGGKPLGLGRRRDGDDALGLEPEKEHRGRLEAEPLADPGENRLERTALGWMPEEGRERSVGHRDDAVRLLELHDLVEVRQEERVELKLYRRTS